MKGQVGVRRTEKPHARNKTPRIRFVNTDGPATLEPSVQTPVCLARDADQQQAGKDEKQVPSDNPQNTDQIARGGGGTTSGTESSFNLASSSQNMDQVLFLSSL